MRGGKYSQGHLWLDEETEPAYWNFSFEDAALFDIPAAVKFIKANRKTDKKITLIGYSQGTTITMTSIILKS